MADPRADRAVGSAGPLPRVPATNGPRSAGHVEVTMDFTREGLAAEGFAGFATWTDLSWDDVPQGPGVYVVTSDSPAQPEFLNQNPAGHFKGRDPTVSRSPDARSRRSHRRATTSPNPPSMRTRTETSWRTSGRSVARWNGRLARLPSSLSDFVESRIDHLALELAAERQAGYDDARPAGDEEEPQAAGAEVAP